MHDHLGLTVPSDTLGMLQDVHRSHGYVGPFPTYSLGNIMLSQVFTKAQKVPNIPAGLQSGDYAPLHGWPTDNIYQHGRSSSPQETQQRITGSGLAIVVRALGTTARGGGETDAINPRRPPVCFSSVTIAPDDWIYAGHDCLIIAAKSLPLLA